MFSLMPWLRKYELNENVTVEEKELRDRLTEVPKEVLLDNFLALEAKYQAMAEKMKDLGKTKTAEE